MQNLKKITTNQKNKFITNFNQQYFAKPNITIYSKGETKYWPSSLIRFLFQLSFYNKKYVLRSFLGVDGFFLTYIFKLKTGK